MRGCTLRSVYQFLPVFLDRAKRSWTQSLQSSRRCADDSRGGGRGRAGGGAGAGHPNPTPQISKPNPESTECGAAQTIRVAAGVSEQEEVQVQVTRVLVQSYFALVRASLQDSVPKAVMHFLVLYVQRGLQQHLIRTLYRCAWGLGLANGL